MPKEFKVGDRVKLIEGRQDNYVARMPYNLEGIITGISSARMLTAWATIKCDNYPLHRYVMISDLMYADEFAQWVSEVRDGKV